MTTYKTYILYTIIALFAALPAVQSQTSDENKWIRRTLKAEKYFKRGKYMRAEAKMRRMIRRHQKRDKAPHMLPATAALYAKYQEAQGRSFEADHVANEHFGEDPSRISFGSDTLDYYAHRYLGSYCKQLKQPQKAHAHFFKAAENAVKADPDSILYQDLLFEIAENLMNQGRYNMSGDTLNTLLQLSERKAKPYITHIDSAGVEVKTRLKRSTLSDQKVKLGRARVMMAENLLQKGDLYAADSLFAENETALDELMPSRYLPVIINGKGYIKTKYLTGEYSAAKAARKIKRKRKKFSNRMRYAMPNELYFDMMHDELTYLNEADKTNKTENRAAQYRREALKSFGNHNRHYYRGRLYELKREIDRGKYSSSLKESQSLMQAKNEYIPALHYDRIEYNKLHARVNRNLFNLNEAERMFERNTALAQRLYGSESPMTGKYLLETAAFRTRYLSEHKKADSLFKLGFELYVDKVLHPYHDDHIHYLTVYSQNQSDLDNFDTALVLIDRAVEAAAGKQGSESTLYASKLSKKGQILIRKGDYLEAEAELEKAAAVMENRDQRWSHEYVELLRTLGSLYNVNGKTQEAEKAYERVYRITRRLDLDESQLSFNQGEDLAEAYINSGRYGAARKELESAIEFKKQKFGETDFQLFKAYYLSGKLNLITGDFTSAERHAKSSLKTLDSDRDEPDSRFLETKVLLGDVYTGMGDYERAREEYDYSGNAWMEKFGINHIMNAEILKKKAELSILDENYDEDPIKILDSAASIVQTVLHDFHPDYAEVIQLKGQILIDREKFDQALTLLDKAKSIYLDSYGEGHLKTADNTKVVADLYYRKGSYDTARVNYESALKAYKKMFDDHHPKYVNTLGNIGQSYYASGNYKEAWKILDETTDIYLSYIERFFPALSDREKAKYWQSIQSDFELFNSLAIEYGREKNKVIRKMYSNQLSTKALLLNNSMKMRDRILSSSDPELVAEFNDWKEKKELLASSIGMTDAEREMNNVNISSMEREINRLEKSLSEKTGAFQDNIGDVPSWRKIRRKLNDDEAVIEMIRFNYFDSKFTDSVLYAALIITNDSRRRPDLVVLENGKELEGRYFKYYRNTVRYKTQDEHSYDQFWKPLEIKLSGINKIYLSPDGIYNQLNPETFLNDGIYLFDRYDIVTVSNSKEVVELKDEDSKKIYTDSNAVLFGNPEFGMRQDSLLSFQENTQRSGGNKVSSVEPLPGAEEEVKEIKTLLGEKNWRTRSYLNAQATESAVKEVVSPRVLHIATHGFFYDEETQEGRDNTNEIVTKYENPLLKSGLLFTGAEELMESGNIYDLNRGDGVLTAFEAMNLSLDNTELVVLSACETGLGEVQAGEGVFGLQRSFRVAGAETIIMTLFKVDDAATQKLMDAFYRNWLATGNKRESFKKAKQLIKREYDSPIYWGSFVMIGED